MNRSWLCIILLTVAFHIPAVAQSTDITASGFLTDSNSGEVLIGAGLLLYKDSLNSQIRPEQTAVTNNYGYFSFRALKPSTNYFLVVKLLGYKTRLQNFTVRPEDKQVKLHIELEPHDLELEEVVIEGKKTDYNDISTVEVSPELLASLPSLTGQSDVMKILEFIPGVSKSVGLSGGLYVRGGSPDQNLTLVDNTNVYNPAHLGNIAPTFNADILRDIKLIKGAFPAEYGGRMSSVMDVKLRSGTKEKETATAGVSLINSFFMMEGPLKEYSTYMVSGRWMYYDLIQKKFSKNSSAPRYYFYDVGIKYSNNVSEFSNYSLSLIFNRDHAYNPPSDAVDYSIDWKNLSVSLNWLNITRGSVFLNSTLSMVNYQFDSKIGVGAGSASRSSFYSAPKLTDYIIKQTAELNWRQNQKLKTGFEFIFHNYDLIYSDYYDEKMETDPSAGSKMNSIEAAYFIQNESDFFNLLSTNLGGRFSYFNDSKVLYFEPRFSTSLKLYKNLYMKSAVALAHQFLHLVLRNDISLPTDLWYPSTKGIEPGSSMQYVVGLDVHTSDGNYLASVEGYYRDMKSIYEFNNSFRLDPLADNLEKQFTKGEGEAYGVEFFLKRTKGKFSGWIGYTLSWSKRKFKDLNFGKLYYPRYDRRHDISVVLSYKLSSRLEAGLTWAFATGQRYTLSDGQFIFDDIGLGKPSQIYVSYPSINTSKFPDFHKLDMNLNYSFTWSGNEMLAYLSLYNVYNRQNPFAQFLVESVVNGHTETKLKRLTLFPFIPSIGIRIKL